MKFIINFKNYKTGKAALSLAKKIEKYLPDAIVCVPATDIRLISEKTKLKVYAQHADYKEKLSSTGFDITNSIKKAGAKGTLLNHSEHKIPLEQIKKEVKELNKLKLKAIVCIGDLKNINEIKKLKPYAIAYEIRSLISTGKSITEEEPKKVKEFVKKFKDSKTLPLCGAGISTKEDILAAKKLGTKGVLIASAIAKAKNPEKLLKELKEVKR